jgi:hypothetical protein
MTANDFGVTGGEISVVIQRYISPVAVKQATSRPWGCFRSQEPSFFKERLGCCPEGFAGEMKN